MKASKSTIDAGRLAATKPQKTYNLSLDGPLYKIASTVSDISTRCLVWASSLQSLEILRSILFLNMSYYSSSSASYLSSSQEFPSYFVPGYGISRHIIFSHIQYYLGPHATVRPYQYRGREGFLVNAPGAPLTRVSLDCLCVPWKESDFLLP